MDLPASELNYVADVRITRNESDDSQRVAACIWARATARRDNLLVPAPVEAKLPGIQRRLSTGAGSLHIAYLRGEAAGFALVVTHESALELVYLAVVPEAWGTGIGSSILTYVDDQARVAGVDGLELWIIDDNERAMQVYERSGWKPTEDLKVSSGRLERRLVKELGERLE
ncbi:GNAT family N-acetyltransferase [Krasilnikovia sp. MM14-A1259]|uniref:GNAT family N-acetyltransferase n=1 Tax=Krasilnikovia sp. MM14-A1259 TaxID=3373539 RepID=UPI003808365A